VWQGYVQTAPAWSVRFSAQPCGRLFVIESRASVEPVGRRACPVPRTVACESGGSVVKARGKHKQPQAFDLISCRRVQPQLPVLDDRHAPNSPRGLRTETDGDCIGKKTRKWGVACAWTENPEVWRVDGDLQATMLVGRLGCWSSVGWARSGSVDWVSRDFLVAEETV